MSITLADMPADDVAQAVLEWEQHAGNNASGAAARLLTEHTAVVARRDLRVAYCQPLEQGVRWASLSADTPNTTLPPAAAGLRRIAGGGYVADLDPDGAPARIWHVTERAVTEILPEHWRPRLLAIIAEHAQPAERPGTFKLDSPRKLPGPHGSVTVGLG